MKEGEKGLYTSSVMMVSEVKDKDKVSAWHFQNSDFLLIGRVEKSKFGGHLLGAKFKI